jgi:threonylcarbamoyladenosine tRNA methylthiotransferase MtaB
MNKALKVAITTLGCKANQYDSSAIEEALADGGLEIVAFPERADAYVINTCTVTSKTDYQSRQLIRRARRTNPEAAVIVTGCYAQVSSEEVGRVEGVDYVLGNPKKDEVLKYILMGRPEGTTDITTVGTDPGVPKGVPITLRARRSSERTRANIKIQDGCDMRCTYCIIPAARGASVSRAPADVEREIDAFVESGYKELVLTGIHLGAYGLDRAEEANLTFTEILKLIERRAWPCRFRISSLDPDEVTDEMIEILKSTKSICNHMHLPLQSGSAGVLQRMGRRYTPKTFSRIVERLYKEIPGVSIGTDIIAGFPGETDFEFNETCGLVEGLPLSYLHVFPYSARSGTPASGYKGRVDPRTVKARCKRLRSIDASKRYSFYKGFVGKEATVLVETVKDRETGLPKGKSDNYIPVLLNASESALLRKNTMVNARLTGTDGASMTATVFE